MAVRVKTKWHTSGDKSVEDIASVLAFTAWKVGVHAVDHIGDENFRFERNQDRFAVLAEILIFLVQIIDRWVHEAWGDGAERRHLVTALVMRLTETLNENQNDWVGKDDYRGRFVALFNERTHEYADFSCTKEGPGYQFRRYLGAKILAVMGEGGSNRWVIDQVMEIEVPDVVKTMHRSLRDLITKQKPAIVPADHPQPTK